MRCSRFDPRRLLRFAPAMMALALVLCIAGSMVVPSSAASADPVMLTATPTANEGILDAVLSVFTKVGEWLSTAVGSLMPMFYAADSGLTFLGVLAVAGLSFSVIFLLIGIIQRFLHFRG